MYTAVLVDTVSIQQYVFGSNKLKENIGASHILAHAMFGPILAAAFEKALGIKIDLKGWETNPSVPLADGLPAGIGFIGGGNALLLFNDDKEAQKLVWEYSLLLLQYFPGLRAAFGRTDNFDHTATGFADSMKRLNDDLRRNKNLKHRTTTPPKHGIVNDCPLSNEAQEVKDEHLGYISQLSNSKLKAAAIAQREINFVTYNQILGSEYFLPDELDLMGQPSDKGYIAVVHMDGNGMGERFKNCKDLTSLRTLSIAVRNAAEKSMWELIAYVKEIYTDENRLAGEDSGFVLKSVKAEKESPNKESETPAKKALPIRPIIVGGDDFTFVCDGRLGVHLAEKLIGFFTKNANGDKVIIGDKPPITACAGVAIVKTKYPFYRAYKLSEDLMGDAKRVSRTEPGSYLQFHVSSGGFSGSYEDIEASQLTARNGKLKFGPYEISKGMLELERGLSELHKDWPRSKLMELRDVMHQSHFHHRYFVLEAESRKRHLPKTNGKDYHDKIWVERKTPYYDMIELLDFYPEPLLHPNNNTSESITS